MTRHPTTRLLPRAVAAALVAFVALAPAADAGWFSRKKDKDEVSSKRGEHLSPSGFSIRSRVIASRPEVQEALAWTESSPDDVAAWRHLGRVLSAAGDQEDAVRAFRVAVTVARDDPSAWSDLGAAYLKLGEDDRTIDAAERALERALAIEPFHAEAHYNLGLVYQLRGDYDASLEAFQQALLIEPELGDVRHNPAAINNPDLPYVSLKVYLETVGANPSIFARDETAPRSNGGE